MKLPGLEFVYEDVLLSFLGPFPADRWQQIDDLAAATSLAWEVPTDIPSWSETRQAVAMSSGLEWPSQLSTEVIALAFAFTPWWVEQLEDDISVDFGYCVSYQVNGVRDSGLFAMILEAYAVGGWPCGWCGEYPEGKLCVYWEPNRAVFPVPSSAHERRIAYQKQRCREQILAGSNIEYGPGYTRRST